MPLPFPGRESVWEILGEFGFRVMRRDLSGYGVYGLVLG